MKCKCGGELLYYSASAIFKFDELNTKLICISKTDARVQCGKCGMIDRIGTDIINNTIEKEK